MPTYLITASLLNSWCNYIGSDEDSEFELETEFVNILNKSGLKYESLPDIVYENIKSNIPIDSPVIQEISEIVCNGSWKVSTSIPVSIAGICFVIRYRCDVITGPTAYKMIFNSRYKIGDYFDDANHRICFECLPGIHRFEYLISDGQNLSTETYSRNNSISAISLISDFVSWLSVNTDYEKIYFEKWDIDKKKKKIEKDVF